MDRRRRAAARARRRGRRRGARPRLLEHVDPTGAYRLTGGALGADGRRVRRDVLRAEVGVAAVRARRHRRCPTRSATPPTPRSARRCASSSRRRAGSGAARAATPCSTATGSSPPRSGTAPPGPATRTCTPTSWSPTSPTPRPMTGGPRSTPGRCTRGCHRSGTSTRPSSAGSSPVGSGSSGARSATASPTSPASPSRCCGSSRPAAGRSRPTSTSTASTRAKAAQVATYATRRRQGHRRSTPDGLLPAWRARAEALGLDAERSGRRARPARRRIDPPTPDSPEAERLYRWLASPEGLTAKVSTFGEREVIKAVCNALPAGGRVDQVLDLVDGFLRSEHVLAVRADRTRGRHPPRRRHGHRRPHRRAPLDHPGDARSSRPGSSPALERRRHAGIAVAGDRVDRGRDRRAADARATSRSRWCAPICSSGDGVDVVEGVAGAGKTFALAAAREAWEASGYRVIGCSLAARAAKQLQDDAGIPASTIDRLLAGIDRHQAALDATTVLVVDEAAMVGTRKLARLLDHAEAAGAKVVLVGDPCQLPEIDAGGAFRGLRARLGASHAHRQPPPDRRVGTRAPSPSSAPATPTEPSTPTSATTASTKPPPTARPASCSSTTG